MKQVQGPSRQQSGAKDKTRGYNRGPKLIQKTQTRLEIKNNVHLAASIQETSYLQHRFPVHPGVTYGITKAKPEVSNLS